VSVKRPYTSSLPKHPEISWFPPQSSNGSGSRVLGLNPWVYDFAAFNLWSRPVGLLACLDALRSCGASVALMDCLDRTWSDTPWPKQNPYGAGHYPKTALPKPSVLSHVPRNYSRYGLACDAVAEGLKRLHPRPDLVVVTSAMTYWYPGVVAALRLISKILPKVPIVLGGVYASLCAEHAKALNLADLVVQGPFEEPQNWARLWKMLGQEPPDPPEAAGFSLALDLYPGPRFSPLLGSRGCPFACKYCVSGLLHPGFHYQAPDTLYNVIQNEYKRGVRDFAFFDDALLVRQKERLWPLLDRIKTGCPDIRLHTPNAIHVRYLSLTACEKLKAAGLTTIRLGLETADFEGRLDQKLNREQWEAGVSNLKQAGFDSKKIGAYILFGLPRQDPEEVVRAIKLVRESGFRPHLSYFSPIPGSALFDKACQSSPYPIAAEPLFQNSSLWPCVPGGFSWEESGKWTSILKG